MYIMVFGTVIRSPVLDPAKNPRIPFSWTIDRTTDITPFLVWLSICIFTLITLIGFRASVAMMLPNELAKICFEYAFPVML